MPEHCAIFGAGLSGRAATRLARAQGDAVTLFDEAGGGDAVSFDAAQVERFDRFIFSPGFAAEHPWRLLAGRSGKPAQSETAYAAGFWKGPLIGITGTNGKTTLTSLMAEALRRAGKSAHVAGNIGQPLSDLVVDGLNTAATYALCEISSFQAELCQGLELDGLLWTNFAEDHLDRYQSLREYFLAKAELFKCLKPGALAILGPGLPVWLERFELPRLPVRIAKEDRGLTARLVPTSVFHRQPYQENFNLAAEYWRLAGEPLEALLAAAENYKLSAHRLDVVREKEGITYWNDSKATNFHAVLAAVRAVPRPLIWIGGGRRKGGDLEAFARELSGQIDVAVLYGEVASDLSEALSTHLEAVHIVPQFEEAVRAASQLAAASLPAQVLLSPGFSSFDQFLSYETRGKSFISIVLSL
ncbi:MAG: UDP-N-acetylmuramoyl-L-alanine--D-glutamate ligase [Opitutales bacterium]